MEVFAVIRFVLIKIPITVYCAPSPLFLLRRHPVAAPISRAFRLIKILLNFSFSSTFFLPSNLISIWLRCHFFVLQFLEIFSIFSVSVVLFSTTLHLFTDFIFRNFALEKFSWADFLIFLSQAIINAFLKMLARAHLSVHKLIWGVLEQRRFFFWLLFVRTECERNRKKMHKLTLIIIHHPPPAFVCKPALVPCREHKKLAQNNFWGAIWHELSALNASLCARHRCKCLGKENQNTLKSVFGAFIWVWLINWRL